MAINLTRFARKRIYHGDIKHFIHQKYFNSSIPSESDNFYQCKAYKYSSKAAFTKKIPSGDSVERQVCDHCGIIMYSNPKIATGIFISYDDEILLTKRDIEPRKGYWCIPGGFLESNESPEDGAIREALEEVNASIVIGSLICVYSIPSVDQILMYYRATLPKNEYSAGMECQDAKMFKYKDIPWDEIAFPANARGLRFWNSNKDSDVVDVHTFRNYHC